MFYLSRESWDTGVFEWSGEGRGGACGEAGGRDRRLPEASRDQNSPAQETRYPLQTCIVTVSHSFTCLFGNEVLYIFLTYLKLK